MHCIWRLAQRKLAGLAALLGTSLSNSKEFELDSKGVQQVGFVRALDLDYTTEVGD